MKLKNTIITAILTLFLTGCATSQPTQSVRVTHEECKAQGGMIIQYDIGSPERCMTGTRAYLIAKR